MQNEVKSRVTLFEAQCRAQDINGIVFQITEGRYPDAIQRHPHVDIERYFNNVKVAPYLRRKYDEYRKTQLKPVILPIVSSSTNNMVLNTLHFAYALYLPSPQFVILAQSDQFHDHIAVKKENDERRLQRGLDALYWRERVASEAADAASVASSLTF